MPRTKLHEIAELGQSVWLDYLKRSLIASGELEAYVESGLRGLTSNPAIFEKAIVGSDEYDDDTRRLAEQGKTALETYEVLAIEDIQRSADVLRPVYDQTDGIDGYVSLEVNPHLAHNTQDTIAEARRLFAAVSRPNVMIKVPATMQGMPAIRDLIAEGININVTLMFSLSQYDQVADAFMQGLEERAANINDLKSIASVASFFVSRMDVKVDPLLDKLGSPKAQALKGKIGIANAKMAYQRFRETFQSERWQRLASDGARIQRVLYGSTSTKNPRYPDTLYVDNLIGPDTINTVPPDTLQAFLDHGRVALTLESDLDQARGQLDDLAELGIDLDSITQQLLEEGVQKFAEPFDKLIESIAAKQTKFLRTEGSR
jgi:transaldolase